MSAVPVIPDDILKSAASAFLDTHAETQPKGEFCTCNACHLGRAYLRMLPVVEAAVAMVEDDSTSAALTFNRLARAVRAMKEQTR